MKRIPVSDIGKYGLIFDFPKQLLPPGAFTGANNFKVDKGGVRKSDGLIRVHTPLFQPQGLFYVNKGLDASSTPLWVYAGLTDVRAFYGDDDREITRLSGDYTGTVTDQWNGGVFNSLLVLTNGIDMPQVWSTPSLSTKLIDLPNWNAAWRAKVMRPFKNFLVALNVLKTSTRYRRMVKWSHTADTSYPSSWDETDATKDAGENNLPEGDSELVDCLPLRDINVVYTEDETWRMQLSGTESIFNFFRVFPAVGLLGQGCAVDLGDGRHFCITQDDIVVHDLNSVNSVAESRVRNYFFDSLDQTYKQMAKVAVHRANREVWVLWPDESSTSERLLNVLVWNWVTNTWYPGRRPPFGARAIMPVKMNEIVSSDSWDGANAVQWSGESTQTWGVTPTSRETSLMLAEGQSGINRIYVVDPNPVDDGAAFLSNISRQGITAVLLGLSDCPRKMLLHAIWPQVSAGETSSFGTTLRVRAGWSDTPEGIITYTAYTNFEALSGEKVDLPGGGVTGRYLYIEFDDGIGALNDFKITGYDLELELVED